MKKILEKLLSGSHLTMEESKVFMEEIIRGNISPHQITAFIVGLKVLKESAEEIIGMVQAMRANMKIPFAYQGDLLDTCGTGGDGEGTINVSTAAAFVAAAAGIPVAKHGNRAVSSKSGSADVLEALGLSLDQSPTDLEQQLRAENLTFLFAPTFHSGMKNAAQSRKELGLRTIFNVLGPLSNPLKANHQVIGVYNANLTETIAEVLQGIGVKRALVVAGLDRLDEITLTTSTKITELKNGKIQTSYIQPEEIGLRKADINDLRGGTPQENAEELLEIFQGKKCAKRDFIVANAGASIYVFGKANGLKQGVAIAEETLDSGKVYQKVIALQKYTKSKGKAV